MEAIKNDTFLLIMLYPLSIIKAYGHFIYGCLFAVMISLYFNMYT